MVLVTPSKDLFGSTLELVVGQEVVKSLGKGKSITLTGNVSIKMETE